MDPSPSGLPKPRRGRRYTKVVEVQPDARPTYPPLTIEQALLHEKALRPRRSRHRVSPEGGFYYWCLLCNYCLPDRSAMCPRDAALYERRRKAREREQTRPEMSVHKALIRDVRDHAVRVNDARDDLIDAINNHSPDWQIYQKHYLDLTRNLIRAARRLPNPPE